jgi:hypothetical protein
VGVRLLLAAALTLPAGVIAFAKEKEVPPDMEMLELLGTFETANGKMIDPLQLKESPQATKTKAKLPSDRTTPKKPELKKKDGNDG